MNASSECNPCNSYNVFRPCAGCVGFETKDFLDSASSGRKFKIITTSDYIFVSYTGSKILVDSTQQHCRAEKYNSTTAKSSPKLIRMPSKKTI